MSEKLTCSNDTLPDQSLLRTANDPHAAILRWADDHPLEAWAVAAAVRGAEPSAERVHRRYPVTMGLRLNKTASRALAYRSILSPLVLRRKIIVATKELLLNLHRDLIQPLFSSVCPIYVMPDRCLKLPYPIFGGS